MTDTTHNGYRIPPGTTWWFDPDDRPKRFQHGHDLSIFAAGYAGWYTWDGHNWMFHGIQNPKNLSTDPASSDGELPGEESRIEGIPVVWTGDQYCPITPTEDSMSEQPYNTDASRGSIKFDQGKNRLDLIPGVAVNEIGKVMSFGATKYASENWRNGAPSWSRYFAALQRHLELWRAGEDLDDDTGLSHLAHAGCNVLFLLYFVIAGVGRDDRYKYQSDEERDRVIAALKGQYPVYEQKS